MKTGDAVKLAKKIARVTDNTVTLKSYVNNKWCYIDITPRYGDFSIDYSEMDSSGKLKFIPVDYRKLRGMSWSIHKPTRVIQQLNAVRLTCENLVVQVKVEKEK